MCGIFGLISPTKIRSEPLNLLAEHARQRGRDSSGVLFYRDEKYSVKRADLDIKKLLVQSSQLNTNILVGHSRLITNGLEDNQPVVRDGVCVVHNGIVVNSEMIWDELELRRLQQIDSEVINGITIQHLNTGGDLAELPSRVLAMCKGTISCAIVVPRLGKLLLFSNNGSLYLGSCEGATYFSSEKYPLDILGCQDVRQIWHEGMIINIPESNEIDVSDSTHRKENLIPQFKAITSEESLLEYVSSDVTRCTKCILPETMPFISFNEKGICNFCENYTTRNKPKPKEELFKLVEKYRRTTGAECIVPFSGGRDSCYGLHLIVKELQMRPVTYTYDWGMVTDLGRRNISRMCSELSVENIIVAADISMKRKYIAANLKAWLKSPHLGMISILTAGDKHFFRYIESIKKQVGVDLNLWGVNPLEVTHFKAGFLGVKPDFEEKRVYMHGLSKQLGYQWLRFKAMLESPGYFNSSLWDTISGEYYRSFKEKKDYYHIFDYWSWEEGIVDKTLDSYDWERATDTSTTWRIGDGTAAFYNYIYYTVAGFSEHDTFRSNQIREGQLERQKAIELVKAENKPRYQNIKWYLDAIGLEFSSCIKTINSIPKLVPK